MNVPRRFAIVRRAVGSFVAAVALAAAAGADDVRSVPAGPVGVAAGVRSYETAIHDAGEASTWFCQVAGVPAVAGSILVARSGGTIVVTMRHALSGAALQAELVPGVSARVLRDGAVVAAADWTAVDAAGQLLPGAVHGFRALQMDPAWQLYGMASSDAALLETLAPAEASASCVAGCSVSAPIPAECATQTASPACCQAQAANAHCVALCGCGDDGPCQAQAQANYAAALRGCTNNAEE